MGSIRIPVTLKNVAVQIKAKEWVEHRDFDRVRWYTGIDKIIAAWRHVMNDDSYEPSNKMLATSLSHMVIDSEELEKQVDNANQVTTDDETWEKMCLAASWTIIQAYWDSVQKGEWLRG